MHTRRDWLKTIGLGVTGIGLTQYKTWAQTSFTNDVDFKNQSIQLGLNENPYGPSPMARDAMSKHINMNRYDRHVISNLISELASKNNVDKNNILVTAGSTEVLDLTVRLAALQEGNFVTAEPTFNYWRFMAQKLGLEKISIPLNANKTHNLEGMLAAITPSTRLVYICNPNNPTGTICDNSALISFIKKASESALVLVDEAYLEFTNLTSVSQHLLDNENVIVAKTFSKIYGLAGARVGYAIAHENTIKNLAQLLTWNGGALSTVSAAGALASLKDTAFTHKVKDLNEKAKSFTIKELEKLDIRCIPSHTNFIYFSLANYKKDYAAILKAHHIKGSRIYENNGLWTRISVGTMDEMKQFINALKH